VTQMALARHELSETDCLNHPTARFCGHRDALTTGSYVKQCSFRLYSCSMEDLTEVVTSEPQARTYDGTGDMYSFLVPYSLVAEQFRVGDKFTYRRQTYEIRLIFVNETTLDFACLRIG
jgi:hypothetical protein